MKMHRTKKSIGHMVFVIAGPSYRAIFHRSHPSYAGEESNVSNAGLIVCCQPRAQILPATVSRVGEPSLHLAETDCRLRVRELTLSRYLQGLVLPVTPSRARVVAIVPRSVDVASSSAPAHRRLHWRPKGPFRSAHYRVPTLVLSGYI